jgi:HEAT repeat protein
MATSRKIEESLAQLAAMASVDAAGLIEQLPPYLGNATNIIVAKAAKLAGKPGVAAALEGDLVKAFHRYLAKGGGGDKGCAAKQAIATVLYESGCASAETSEVFLIGVRWVQREPVYGGSTDTAAELRGISAMGLVRAGYPRAMEILVDLLADESAQARIMAVRALAYANQDSGALLLRLAILKGDRDDRVIAEAITAVGQISGIKALEFFRRFLSESTDGSLFSAAAMAIGEMRHADALEALLTVWRESMTREVREALLLPIALCRLPAAVDFLIGVVAEHPEALACGAVEAFAIYQHDPQQRGKIAAAVRDRGDEAVTRKFERSFPAR